ncbi:MAG: rhodanese-like domain-containing protein [Acidobacteria bacterium]|nr:rhodanese-like domain-containing protein [Acidobacteriota bacterium]
MTRKFLLVFVTLAAVVIGNLAVAEKEQTERPKRIAISELKKKLDSGEKLLLVDVREDWELKEDGAIPGAIHIPVAELDKRMKDIPKDIQLIFY